MVNKKNKITIPLIAVFLVAFFTSSMLARGPNKFVPTFHKAQIDANEPLTRTLSNISNWAYWIAWDGMSAHDPILDDSGGIYPRATTHVIFTDGLVWGGYAGGINPNNLYENLRVGGVTYAVGTVPGWVENGTPVSQDNPRVGIYRIRKDYTEYWDEMTTQEKATAKSELRQEAAEQNAVSPENVTEEMIQFLVDNYAWAWENWPADLGAPTYEDGTPGIAGADQVVWFVVNDFDQASTIALYGSPPIGIELQTTLWSYNQPDATLGQIVFKKYKFINKSGDIIDSMFVSQWSDPDVGNYTDDLTGSDVDLSLMFGYTGFITDASYSAFGLPPAAVGYDFFQGPIVPSPGDTAIFDLKELPGYKNLPMTSYGYFSAGAPISDPPLGDPVGTLEWYNMLNGYTPTDDLENPTPYVHGAGPNKGEATKFPLNGDPFRQTGDIDAFGENFPPGDRRMFMSSGPFTMQPGDTQEVVVAVVGGIIQQQGGNNRNAVEQVKINDRFAQFMYNNLFQAVPKPPSPPPSVNVTEMENKIVLEWGSQPDVYQQTESPDTVLGFKFEGYNVYQLPSRSATKAQAKLVATFDVPNLITTIRAKKFVPEFGDIIEVPVQRGTDNGIQRFFYIEKDYINDAPLYPGTPYYFAVTAYNYNDDPEVPEPTLETSLSPIEVIPQSPPPGTQYNQNPGDALEIVHKDGESHGEVVAEVINPAEITGHTYEVTFDTSGGKTLWNLWDSTANKTVLENETLLDNPGSKKAKIVDGFLIGVAGPPAGINPKRYGDAYGAGTPTSLTYLTGWDFDGPRWISGTNWGGIGLFGGLDNGYNFFGSTIDESTPTLFTDVELRFAGDTQANDPDRWSKASVYRRDQGYAYAGIGDAPFAAWDVENNRRLNICFVEMDSIESENNENIKIPANMIWDMGWHEYGQQIVGGDTLPPDTGFGTLGGREYAFIMNSDYDPTTAGGYDDANWGPAADVLYAFWPSSRGTHPYLEGQFELQIFASNVILPIDRFSFKTKPTKKNDLALMKEEVKKINVFPNPYYAFHRLETDRFDRFVKFNHLPPASQTKTTIRIFNLAGTQVRKLEKKDDSQFMPWDLRNESGLPVASGLYIAHIDMPDIGEKKVLKIFIVQSEQILEYY